MTRAEIVRRAIDFDRPPRLPMKFEIFGYNDCYDVWTRCESEFDRMGVGCDEWGCRWERSEVHNMGQIKGHPIADVAQAAAFTFPDPDAEYRYGDLDQKLEAAEDRYVMFCGGNGIFERSHFLCGMSPLLEALYVCPDEVAHLISRIGDFHIRVLQNVLEIARGRIHSVAWADDWGTQQATFISPPAFGRFFKPIYERMFDVAHEHGLHTWLHSCGRVNAFVGDLIEIGLNVINLQQPRTVGIAEIGSEYAGRICFESIVDIQSTYPRGTREEINAEAAELLARWNTPAGGFIASDYNDAEAIGTTIERRTWAFEAFAGFAPPRR
jgi:uroporphyrinogen decarboxylase